MREPKSKVRVHEAFLMQTGCMAYYGARAIDDGSGYIHGRPSEVQEAIARAVGVTYRCISKQLKNDLFFRNVSRQGGELHIYLRSKYDIARRLGLRDYGAVAEVEPSLLRHHKSLAFRLATARHQQDNRRTAKWQAKLKNAELFEPDLASLNCGGAHAKSRTVAFVPSNLASYSTSQERIALDLRGEARPGDDRRQRYHLSKRGPLAAVPRVQIAREAPDIPRHILSPNYQKHHAEEGVSFAPNVSRRKQPVAMDIPAQRVIQKSGRCYVLMGNIYALGLETISEVTAKRKCRRFVRRSQQNAPTPPPANAGQGLAGESVPKLRDPFSESVSKDRPKNQRLVF